MLIFVLAYLHSLLTEAGDYHSLSDLILSTRISISTTHPSYKNMICIFSHVLNSYFLPYMWWKVCVNWYLFCRNPTNSTGMHFFIVMYFLHMFNLWLVQYPQFFGRRQHFNYNFEKASSLFWNWCAMDLNQFINICIFVSFSFRFCF